MIFYYNPENIVTLQEKISTLDSDIAKMGGGKQFKFGEDAFQIFNKFLV